jgi:hypothetical protein
MWWNLSSPFDKPFDRLKVVSEVEPLSTPSPSRGGQVDGVTPFPHAPKPARGAGSTFWQTAP